jgi:SH3 domain protein
MVLSKHKQVVIRPFQSLSLTLVFLGWLLSTSVWAKTLYVSDTTLRANMRTGTTIQNRIIAMLEPGRVVTFLGEKDGWAEVTLEDGRTGWILSHFLSERPPWRVTAERLEREKERLQTRLGKIEGEHKELVEESTALKKEMETRQTELVTLRQEYEELKASAANYLNLKMAYENLQTEARQSKANLEDLQQAHDKLKMSNNIRWFLSGTGVLLLGWLVGMSMGRMRRRRSGDLYRL